MGHSHGKRWSDAMLLAELREHTDRLGRMPTVNELRTAGRNDLAVAATRAGLQRLRVLLGLSEKDSGTARGRRCEEYVAGVLRLAGHDVERQSTRAPFDLLVDAVVRVNVKSAAYHEYSGTDSVCRGHFFGIGDTWKRCDVFAFVPLDTTETPTVLWVPAAEAQQQTLTLTRAHPFHGRTSYTATVSALRKAS